MISSRLWAGTCTGILKGSCTWYPGSLTTWRRGHSLSGWKTAYLRLCCAAPALHRGLCSHLSCSPCTHRTSPTTRSHATSRSFQQTSLHFVCCCQCPLLCCGVLGRQHKEEGCGATGQAGEEGSCCWHWTGVSHNSGGEKDPEQVADYSGQWPPPPSQNFQ